MVYGIRIQKYSVYGIWYKHSEVFSILCMVEGFRRIQYMVYGIRIQKDSVLYGIWNKDSEGFNIWYVI